MSIALTVHYNVSEILEDKWAGSMNLWVRKNNKLLVSPRVTLVMFSKAVLKALYVPLSIVLGILCCCEFGSVCHAIEGINFYYFHAVY